MVDSTTSQVFEYAAVTLAPSLCSMLTDKNFINQPSPGQETNRP